MAIFDNCIIQAPDGVNLSRCGIKKAKWYLSRGLGSLVSDDPMTIRLHFEPSGRNGIEDPLLMDGKPNICVVCGTTENLTRHHIIPYCFIRHMRLEYKVDIIRDIFPLCVECHNRYEQKVHTKREELAARMGVKLHGLPEEDYHRLRKAKSAALALHKYGDRIPARRTQELQSIVNEYLQAENITKEELLLQDGSGGLEVHPGFINVMKEIAIRVTDYSAFAREWRQHFVTTMKPKYMPEVWTVDRETDPKAVWVPQRMLRQNHSFCGNSRSKASE